MASVSILHALFASLIGQAIVPTSPPPPSTTPIANRPIVHTLYGSFQGVQKKTASNVFVDTFLGIPFAAPPVGQLRFQKPSPYRTSQGIRDASSFGKECIQLVYPSSEPLRIGDTPLPMSEDCLYLNIYKPVRKDRGLLPVMVFVHGGSLESGAGSHYEGSELAANGVILVTFNYRLDIFGFLSNEDNVIPGNYGMLDQVMALKWVKENIRSFGGDPDKVTIFGESSGSTSVSLLVLSPLCKGLFKRAIMESGTSMTSWAIYHPASKVAPRYMTSLIGSYVGCLDWNTQVMLECLRGVDSEKLLEARRNASRVMNYEVFTTPVVETTYGFLPDLPIKMWTQNKFNHVDTIRGFNKAENGGILGRHVYNISRERFIHKVNNILAPYAVLDKEELVREVLNAYVGNETDGHNILVDLGFAISDLDFKGPTLTEANIESKLSPENSHYIYEFDHKSSISTNPSWMEATHFEEIPFVFGIDLEEFTRNGKIPNANDNLVSKQMQTLWTNFAKYGDPTRTVPSGAVSWEKYNVYEAMALQIRSSSRIMSLKNDKAVDIFSKILRRLDMRIPDTSIIG